MNAYNNAAKVGYVFYLIAIILIVYGLINWRAELKFSQKGVTTLGTVYDLNVVEPYRQAMVEFKTQDGRTVQFVDKLFWNNQFEKYKIGQEVVVIYDPANPEYTATINDFFQRNTAPWWPFILGVIFFIIGIIFRSTMKKKAVIYQGHLDGTIPYNPESYNKSTNKAMLWMLVFVIFMILLLVIAFGIYGK